MAKFKESMKDRLPPERLSRTRRQASEVVYRLRKQSATLTGQEIVDAIRRDRERTER